MCVKVLFVSGMKGSETVKKDNENTTVLYKRKAQNKSPLLDEYIQRQCQESKFDGIPDKDIAKAIRTLLHKDDTLHRNLN